MCLFNELSLDAGKPVGYTDHRHTDSAGAGRGPGRPGTTIDQSEADTHGPLHSCSLPQMSRVGLRRAACSDLLELFEIHRAVFLPTSPGSGDGTSAGNAPTSSKRWPQPAPGCCKWTTSSRATCRYRIKQSGSTCATLLYCLCFKAAGSVLASWSSSRRRRPRVICPSSSASSGRTWRQGASTSASGSSRRKAGKPIST